MKSAMFLIIICVVKLFILLAWVASMARQEYAEWEEQKAKKAAALRAQQERARKKEQAAAAKAAEPKRPVGRPRKAPTQPQQPQPRSVSLDDFAARIATSAEDKPQPFPCMLAQKFFDKPAAIVGKPVAVTEKLDGVRAVAVIRQGDAVELFTRQGKPIQGLQKVEAAILNAAKTNGLTDCTLDGELLITRRENLPSKEQYRQTVKIVRSGNTVKTGITFHAFDMIDPSNPSMPYDDRRRTLDAIFAAAPSSSALQLVPVLTRFTAGSEQEARSTVLTLVEWASEEGREGIMLNICTAPYVGKRTPNLLKAKVFQDCDLKIIGFKEGSGRLAGTLGALVVDYKGNALGVGTGFTNAQRAALWQNRAALAGRVVTVQYFEESSDASGKKSLRFPVFKELRELGKEVSYA